MKGYVYAIRSHLTEKIYVGSTQSPLSVRMAGHRADFRNFQAGKQHYISSYDLLGFEDAYIEALEVVEFKDKAELKAREGHFQRTLDCVNRRIEDRTLKEYRADNAEYLNAKAAKWYLDNAEVAAKTRKIALEPKMPARRSA